MILSQLYAGAVSSRDGSFRVQTGHCRNGGWIRRYPTTAHRSELGARVCGIHGTRCWLSVSVLLPSRRTEPVAPVGLSDAFPPSSSPGSRRETWYAERLHAAAAASMHVQFGPRAPRARSGASEARSRAAAAPGQRTSGRKPGRDSALKRQYSGRAPGARFQAGDVQSGGKAIRDPRYLMLARGALLVQEQADLVTQQVEYTDGNVPRLGKRECDPGP